MLNKIPKNSDKYQWTTHSVYKMHQYGLSEQKIRNVIRSPFRKEEGIVKNTIAVMQPVSPKVDEKNKKIWKQEIWVMYQFCKSKAISNFQFPNSNKIQSRVLGTKFKKLKTTRFELESRRANKKLKIISVWRYPGVSPERNPIPEEILREIANLSEK